jgi:hypothetical protein
MFVGGDFLYSLERESVNRLLLGSAHLLQERLEGNEAVIVGGVAELLHQVLGLLLGQLLTEVHQQLEQLELQDGVVDIFVVQLQDLNEVVEATLVLGVLAGLVHGEDIGLGEELLALGDSTADLLDGLQGGVQVAGADEVANVEGVDLAVSLEVIDVKGEVDGWKASELGRWWCVGGTRGGKGGLHMPCHRWLWLKLHSRLHCQAKEKVQTGVQKGYKYRNEIEYCPPKVYNNVININTLVSDTEK